MDGNLKIFQTQLKQALQKNGVSLKQKEVAKFLGVSAGTAWHYLNGTRIPRFSRLNDIASRLGVNAQFLLTNHQLPDLVNSSGLLSFAQNSPNINSHLVTLPIIDVQDFMNQMRGHILYLNQNITLNEAHIKKMLHLDEQINHLAVLWNHSDDQVFFNRFDWVLGTTSFQKEDGIYLIETKNQKIIYQKFKKSNFGQSKIAKDKILFKLCYKMTGELL